MNSPQVGYELFVEILLNYTKSMIRIDCNTLVFRPLKTSGQFEYVCK